MNKVEVTAKIISELEAQIATAMAASKEAAAYATDDESRAESKWDTQGLEASYLAAGQAGQVKKLDKALQLMKQFQEAGNVEHQSISIGSLVECELGGSPDWFFLSPEGGGMVIQIDSIEVTIITPDSPIGQRLMKLKSGSGFALPNGNPAKVLSVQ